MKNKKYLVKGTPIAPSLCGILMAVLWYLFFYFSQGEWMAEMQTLSFSEMSGTEIYLSLLTLASAVLFFVAVLFFAETDLRLVLVGMIAPIVQQISMFVIYFRDGSPEYLFHCPVEFIAPFLVLILYVLTVEKVIPNKWIFVGFCGLAVVLPLVLTLCGTGEFVVAQEGYDELYNTVTYRYYLWSDYLEYALYYVGLGALVLQMRPPRESDFVTLAEMKQAYEEKMAAEAEAEAEEEAETVEEEAETVEKTETAPETSAGE